jgi:hypothetical protein
MKRKKREVIGTYKEGKTNSGEGLWDVWEMRRKEAKYRQSYVS